VRVARFIYGRRIAYGIVHADSIEEISTTPFLPYERSGVVQDLSDVRLLAPCIPSKVVAIALNYADHVAEMGKPAPSHPVFFFKPSTAVVGPGDKVVAPAGCKQLDYEGELTVVIGGVAKGVDAKRFEEVVLGYTCGIDATARDLQRIDSQWGRAKGFDTSAPLGPWIETELDPADLSLVTKVNGRVKQDSRTSQMIFDVPSLIAFVTSYVTLLPGDVIMTGTPAGIGPLSSGDSVSVEIEGIGALQVAVGATASPE
jgi:2-keto-4-pentenoate hydratase/2-oxohepta-3-ene-1,7-dioic acid hydratase in catechol pathway